ASIASTSVVLPPPEWPTSTTLRTWSGWSTSGALPAAAWAPTLSATCYLLVRGPPHGGGPPGVMRRPPPVTGVTPVPSTVSRPVPVPQGVDGIHPAVWWMSLSLLPA